jgi:ligand-binding SRPBCC domain-containing protein
MPTILVETIIDAPVEVCFDGARDIGLHCATANRTKERAVAGVTIGLIGLGESVTFEAVHLGVRQRLTGRITEFDRPNRFADDMTQGAFKSLRHIHEFLPCDRGTLMRDTLIWVSPFGPLGKMADTLFLKRHMRNFLKDRNANLKAALEASR